MKKYKSQLSRRILVSNVMHVSYEIEDSLLATCEKI